MALMSIDLGTSSVKVSVFDQNTGKILATGQEKYMLISTKQGYIEQNPDDWWKATKLALKKCISDNLFSKNNIEG